MTEAGENWLWFFNVKYICDSVACIWDITANSTKQKADYKVANIGVSEEE